MGKFTSLIYLNGVLERMVGWGFTASNLSTVWIVINLSFILTKVINLERLSSENIKMLYDQQLCQKLMDFLFVFPSRNYRDVSGMRVTTLQTMRRKPPACVRRDRSARTGEPQRSVSCALPRSLIHSFCRLSLLISDEKGASFWGKWCSHTKAWKCAFMLRKERSSCKASALRAKVEKRGYNVHAMLDLLTKTFLSLFFLGGGGQAFSHVVCCKGH